MNKMTAKLGVAALAALLAAADSPSDLVAQQQEQEAEAASRQELVAEVQEIQGQLMELREEAMKDEKLQREEAELQQTVTAAMREIDPRVEEKLARSSEIQQEMRTAQEEGDQQKVGALIQEAQAIETDLRAAQERVMAHQEVQEAVESFREGLFDRMRELDPEADGLIRRAEELTQKLQAEQGD